MQEVFTEKKDDIVTEHAGSINQISISMSGTNKNLINKISREFYEFVRKFDMLGELPSILPVEEACLTTRKSPCGNGTATFSRYKLRVHQRLFKLHIYDKNMMAIVDFLKNSPVDVQLKAE